MKRSASTMASQREERGSNGLLLSQENQLRILKEQLFNSNREIQSLRHQIEDLRNNHTQTYNQAHLLDAKRKVEIKLIEARQELVTIDSDYQVKKDIFMRNKDYNSSLLEQANDLSNKKQLLEKQHREKMQAGSQVEDLQDEINNVKKERNQLQREFDNIMSQPFFKKELDSNNLDKLKTLEEKIRQQEDSIKKSRTNITKHMEECHEIQKEIKSL